MNKEATKYCEECQNCKLIEQKRDNYYLVQCTKRSYAFYDEVVYCKYKKIKKENKRNA